MRNCNNLRYGEAQCVGVQYRHYLLKESDRIIHKASRICINTLWRICIRWYIFRKTMRANDRVYKLFIERSLCRTGQETREINITIQYMY